MYYPTKEEFKQKAKQGNLIPVYKEILGDLETPVSAFYKISQGGKYGYLLESVEKGEKLGRYSFLGASPSIIFKSKGSQGVIIKDGKEEIFNVANDPLIQLKKLMSQFKPVKVDGLPRFYGGAVGYLSYDYVRFIEELPDKNPDNLNLPDTFFVITDTILIFDHLLQTIKVVSNAYVDKDPDLAYEKAIEQIEGIITKLRQSIPVRNSKFEIRNSKFPFQSNFTKNGFEKIVKGAKEYIKAGDIIQVVLSQRLTGKIHSEPLTVYRALRRINPSPYMFYLKYDEVNIVGSSPELLVRLEEGEVETRPIAGTKPRGINEKADDKYAKELLADPKENAEHIMLVDLGRNDIGRVCEYKSIHLPEFMVIEKYSHVMHIVTSVKGKLLPQYDAFSLIRACFPAGTVTGAPKVRAMEIINEFEPERRGPYAGCVGYFSFSGNLDTCITIRTIVIKDGKAYLQAGAGIVADSNPETEYYETMNKLKCLIDAVELAEKGLQ
ncbi:MAG: anthranilate synthase component I [bacterium]